MKYRIPLTLSLLMALVMLFTACTVPVAPTEGGASSGKTQLLYTTHSFDPAIALNEEIISEFEEMYPDVDIVYDNAPHSNFEQKILTAFAGGEGPDVFWAGDWMVPQFIEQGIIAPVDPTAYGVDTQVDFLELFEEGSLDPFTVEGTVYSGGVSEYNTFSLLYNVDHFEEAGLDLPSDTEPMTWQELATIAETLAQQDDGGNITRNGIVWPQNVPIWTVLILEPILHQQGGSLLDSDTGLPQFDSPEMINTMQFAQDLRFEQNAFDPALMTGLLDDFAGETTSMIIAGPWAISNLNRMNPELNYAVAPLPVWEGGERVTTLYAWAWFVNPNIEPEMQELGWKFVEFLTSKGDAWWDNVRYVQSRKIETATGEALQDYFVSTEPLMPVFLEDYKYGRFEFRSTKYFELSDIWTRAQTRIMEGEDVATVMQEAQVAAEFALE